MAANNPAAAANAAPRRREEVLPIDPGGTTDRERGQVTYRYNTEAEPTGVFSFAWYYRPRPTAGNRNQTEPVIAGKFHTYLFGMSKYYGLTESEAFAGWKIVIYTDRATLEAARQLPETPAAPARTLAADLLSRPNTIVAVCEWPEFSQTQTAESIDGVILRSLRHKALMDFSDVPVFVRDADTYFTHELYKDNFDARLLAWETTMLQRHRDSGLPFLVAGTPTYSRVWHRNRLHDVKSEGVLAGLVNRIGNIPEWTDGSLWRESLSFVRGRCRIVPDTGALSNVREGTYIGKDEQMIIFIWIPALLDRTFFFYFDFHEGGFTSGNYIDQWTETRGRPHFHRGAAEAVAAEFPDFVRDGRLSSKIGESPYYKLYSTLSRRVMSPNPWTPQPTQEEIQAERADEFERGIKLRRFSEVDRPLLEEARGQDNEDFTLLHPFIVRHAFDFPAYQRIMYHMFRETTDNYRAVCDRARGAAGPGAAGGGAAGGGAAATGGKRQRRGRTSKKRAASRRKSRRVAR